MIVILDTDILSMFAKVDAIKLLKDLFGKEKLAITPGIEEEISVPLEYGYKYPSRVLSGIRTIPLTEKALLKLKQLHKERTNLGKGETEAIAMCKAEGYIFATNDLVARKFAKKQKIKVLSLQSILRAMWKIGLKSKEETKELFNEIVRSDDLRISREIEREIFAE